MPLNGFRGSVFACALLAAGCTTQAAVPPPALLLSQGSGLTANDDIDGIDAATDANGDVHLVWTERSNVYGGSGIRERLVYRHGSGSPLHWGPRVVIASGAMGSQRTRIVATPGGVHFFSGPRLQHRWLTAGTDTPRDLGDTLAADGMQAGAFDAAADGDGIRLVFTSQQDGHAALQALRWTTAGPQAPVTIATSQDFRGARPQLLRDGAQWRAVWADNALVQFRDPQDGLLEMRLQAGIRTAVGDGRWGSPAPVASSPSDVVALAAQNVGGKPVLFFASNGLFETRLAAAWTSPVRIAAFKKGFLAGSDETSAVAATQCKGHTVIAWTDARYRKSDRRLWNPLGGFPWGDAPDWYNNDLFVTTHLPQAPASATTVVPLRLTIDGSMTRDIAIVVRGGQLLAFRTGRARVHKAPNDAGAPPEVTQSTLSCD